MKRLIKNSSNEVYGPEYNENETNNKLNYNFNTHSIVYVDSKLYIGGDHMELNIEGLENWFTRINANEKFISKFWNDWDAGIDIYTKNKGLKTFWAEKSSDKINTIDVFIVSNMLESEVNDILFNHFPYCKIVLEY